MSGINRVNNRLHFFVNRLTEIFRSKFHARLNQCRVRLDGKVGIFVFVIQNPALALGHDLIAEFFGGQLISPLAKRSLGKLLDISLVYQGHTLAPALQGKLDRHAHQTLGSCH